MKGIKLLYNTEFQFLLFKIFGKLIKFGLGWNIQKMLSGESESESRYIETGAL